MLLWTITHAFLVLVAKDARKQRMQKEGSINCFCSVQLFFLTVNKKKKKGKSTYLNAGMESATDLQEVVGWEKEHQEAPSSFFENFVVVLRGTPRSWTYSCGDTVNAAVHRGLTDKRTDGHQQVHLPFPAVVGAAVAPGRND